MGGTELTTDLKSINQVRARVGMVFQSFNLFPHISVLDNLTLAPIKVRGVAEDEAKREAIVQL